MTPPPRPGPNRLRLELADLSPVQFEDLIYDLVRRGWPDARKVAAPDGGADIHVPSEGRIFQCKHFTGRINFSQCKRSLRDAIEHFDPEQVTFVFSKPLTKKQWDRVDEQLVSAAGDVRVSVWALHDIHARLTESPDLRARHLGGTAADAPASPDRPAPDREVLSQYLTKLIARLAELPDYYPSGFAFDEIRQRVRVSTHRIVAEEPEDAQAGATGKDRRPAARSVRDFDRRYEHRTEAAYGVRDPDAVKDWEEVRDEATRAVLLADPGFGKTWLLRAEGLRIARASLRMIEAGREIDDVPVPIFSRLDAFAAELESGHPVADALARAAARPLMDVTPPEAVSLVESLSARALEASSTLLLDGLDELQDPDRRAAVAQGLRTLAEGGAARILITSRIVGYTGSPLGPRGSREFELVALGAREVERFINTWFGSDEDARRDVRTALRRGTLRQMARIPLLLSFLCLVASGRGIPKSRGELYEQMLRQLIEGRWRGPSLQEADPARIEAKLALLEHIAWHFAVTPARWQEQMDGGQIADVIRAAPETAELGGPSRSGSLLRELSERDGILVKVGVEPPGTSVSAVPFLFLHRTFAEYLVARKAARLPSEELAEFVRVRLWNSADWEEVLVLLAAVLDDATPLIQIIEAETDAFGTMQRLAVRCVSANVQLAADPEFRSQRLGPVQDALKSPSRFERDAAARALADYPYPGVTDGVVRALMVKGRGFNDPAFAVLSSIGNEMAADFLTTIKDAGLARVASAIEDAPEDEPGDPPGENPLDRLLDFVLGDAMRTIARSYGAIDRERSARELFDLDTRLIELRRQVPRSRSAHRFFELHREIIKNLVELGPVALPVALDAATSEALNMRLLAYRVLGEISDKRAIPVIRQGLERGSGDAVVAAEAAAKLGDEEAVPALIALLAGEPGVAAAAARALAQLAGSDEADDLREHLERSGVTLAAARAAGAMTKEYASQWTQFAATAEALLAVGEDEAAVQLATELTAAAALTRPDPEGLAVGNDDLVVRIFAEAAEVLARASERVLLELLRDWTGEPRWAAVRAIRPGLSALLLDAVIALLDSPDATDRVMAIDALSATRSAAALARLEELMWDSSARVREHACAALVDNGATLSEEQVRRLVDAEESALRVAGWDLADVRRSPGLTAEFMLARLETEPSRWVKGALVGALGRSGDETAVDQLTQLVVARRPPRRGPDDTDPEEIQRDSAVREDLVHVTRFMGRRLYFLIESLFGDPLATAAAEALGEIGTRACVPPLVDALGATDRSLVRAAERGLVGLADDEAIVAAGDALIGALEATEPPALRVAAAEILGELTPRLATAVDDWEGWRERCANAPPLPLFDDDDEDEDQDED